MPLLLVLFALFVPRVVAVLLWLFTDWFASAFDEWLIPLLGFLFFPYTLLWYSVVLNWYGGTWGPWQILFGICALAFDLSSYSGARRHRQRETR